jgi:hypothetical protein
MRASKSEMSAASQPPRWVDVLLKQKFFHTCPHHNAAKKNECNNFCVTCTSQGLCQHCLPSHANHQTVQIRRYVYHDVVKLTDVEPLLQCEGIQSYYINNARVAFLNQRPQLRPLQGPGQACEVCHRSLQDDNRFCSIACKVDSLAKAGNGFAPPPSTSGAASSDSTAPGTPEHSQNTHYRNSKRKASEAASSEDEYDEVSLTNLHGAKNLRRLIVTPKSHLSRRKAASPCRSPVC